MSKRKIAIASVLLPAIALVVVVVKIAFAARPPLQAKYATVAERFNAFKSTFKTDAQGPGDARSQVKMIQAAIQHPPVPGALPPPAHQTIGCNGSFCALTATFASTSDLQRFATNNPALKTYYAWSGPKFVIALSPKANAQDRPLTPVAAAHHAALMIGIGTPPPPAGVKAASDLQPNDDSTSCSWPKVQTARRSYQLSASACAGYLGSAFPSDLGSGPAGKPNFVWESLYAQAFMKVDLGSATTTGPASGSVRVPMTENRSGVLVCPVPYEAVKETPGKTDVPTKMCATVALFAADTKPNCRIHWIASRGDDSEDMNIERFSGVQTVSGTGAVKVTVPMIDTVDPTWYQFFDIEPGTPMEELTGMDVLCDGMQPGDRVFRYRFDYEFKSVTPS